MTYVRYVYFGPSVVYFPATFFFSDCIDLDIRQRWRYGFDLRGVQF
jgi:hypothetical protein